MVPKRSVRSAMRNSLAVHAAAHARSSVVFDGACAELHVVRVRIHAATGISLVAANHATCLSGLRRGIIRCFHGERGGHFGAVALDAGIDNANAAAFAVGRDAVIANFTAGHGELGITLNVDRAGRGVAAELAALVVLNGAASQEEAHPFAFALVGLV